MNPPKILMVEDEPHQIEPVIFLLERNGCQVTTAQDGDEGLRKFKELSPDLVVLDLNLPGMKGLDLFREMRRLQPNIPVMMLTALTEENDRVLGLELGADDYVTKPFYLLEVVARVKKLLRQKEDTSSHGPLTLDSDTFTAQYFGETVSLTPAEFKVMSALVRHPARVFTRKVLISLVYNGEFAVDERSVDACVRRLRKKFAAIRPDVSPIETSHGFGYKLNSNLEDASP